MNVLDRVNELCDILEKNYLNQGYNLGVDFYPEIGNKYYKIIYDNHNQRSVHAFVDKVTGDIYKPASWRGPAKGARYNLLNDIPKLAICADWAGGYLYR